MDRRAFFSGLIGAVATAALDPERLLWKPIKKIFIPSPLQTTITLENVWTVSFEWDAVELAELDLYHRYMVPAIDQMMQETFTDFG